MAMAWVESAVVYYLRTHIDRIEPYQANPLPLIGGLGPVELVRELATLIMLFTVGLLAGRTWRARFGYIAHRVRRVGHFLLRLSEGDVRLAAFVAGLGHSVSAAAAVVGAGARPDADRGLMIVWGTLASQFERRPAPAVSNGRVWVLCFLGHGAGALRIHGGRHARSAARRRRDPRCFARRFQLAAVLRRACALMAAPVVQELWSAKPASGKPPLKARGQTDIPVAYNATIACKPTRPQSPPETQHAAAGEVADARGVDDANGSAAVAWHAMRSSFWARAVLARRWAGGAIRSRRLFVAIKFPLILLLTALRQRAAQRHARAACSG